VTNSNLRILAEWLVFLSMYYLCVCMHVCVWCVGGEGHVLGYCYQNITILTHLEDSLFFEMSHKYSVLTWE
jgi:hypothetical protein